MKTTLKEIKAMVRCGVAKDITNITHKEALAIRQGLTLVAYSWGKYGRNGAMYLNRETGELLAITSGEASVFILY